MCLFPLSRCALRSVYQSSSPQETSAVQQIASSWHVTAMRAPDTAVGHCKNRILSSLLPIRLLRHEVSVSAGHMAFRSKTLLSQSKGQSWRTAFHTLYLQLPNPEIELDTSAVSTEGNGWPVKVFGLQFQQCSCGQVRGEFRNISFQNTKFWKIIVFQKRIGMLQPLVFCIEMDWGAFGCLMGRGYGSGGGGGHSVAAWRRAREGQPVSRGGCMERPTTTALFKTPYFYTSQDNYLEVLQNTVKHKAWAVSHIDNR